MQEPSAANFQVFPYLFCIAQGEAILTLNDGSYLQWNLYLLELHDDEGMAEPTEHARAIPLEEL